MVKFYSKGHKTKLTREKIAEILKATEKPQKYKRVEDKKNA